MGGSSYHKTGGNPVTFTYAVETPWMDTAKSLLKTSEFLAPHFWVAPSGHVYVMVAPHLLVDGKVMKGAGPDDNFIIVAGDAVKRFDYSMDVSMMMKDKM